MTLSEKEFNELLAKGKSPGVKVEELGNDILFISVDTPAKKRKIISEKPKASEHT